MSQRGSGRARRPSGVCMPSPYLAASPAAPSPPACSPASLGLTAAQADALVRDRAASGKTLVVKGTAASDRLALRLRAGAPDKLEVDVGDNGSADFSDRARQGQAHPRQGRRRRRPGADRRRQRRLHRRPSRRASTGRAATTRCAAAAAPSGSTATPGPTRSTATAATTSPTSAPATTASSGIRATAATRSRAARAPTR